MRRQAGLVLGMLFLAHVAAAQFTQQGSKLVGTGAVGSATQGTSVAFSGDGNTAIVGGSGDNSSAGAAWVFTRSGGVWSQQGSKLVGTGAVGSAEQGVSVAISGDGNTAIVGGVADNSSTGAAWVYTRSGGVWTQQGSKLVGTGAVGAALQGISVAISALGDTAIVGGYNDSGGSPGAAWVFTRSGGVWTQQGSKLVGTGATGTTAQGISVAISGDGNTAIIGGFDDNSQAGAAWVYTRSGGVWTQQGSKLVGTGAVGAAWQSKSVSLSGNGNTAIVGGTQDNSAAGAAWIFTRSGGVWTQLGSKLFGTGAVGTAQQGYSVAISADGTTAIVGGLADNSFAGAAWVFISSVSATQLAFVQQPTSATAGTLITPAVTVQLEDSGGNPVAQSGVTITMSLSSGTGTLGGTLSQVTNASGLATFNDLSIILVGSKQLTAASIGLTSAVSNAFTITAAVAVNIVVTGGTPQSAPISTLFAQALQVTVTDTFGNPVVGALVTFSAPSSGASASLSNGGNATTDASGHASVTATANGIVGGPYLVSATTGTLEPITFSLTNLQGGANAIPMLGSLGLLGLALLVLLVGAIVLREL